MHQAIQTSTMVVNLPTAGTRWGQQRDGEVGAEALQVQRGSVGAGPGGFPISMGANARQTGEAVSVVSEARQSSRRLDTARSQRPAFPEVSQAGVGCHATEEIPDVLAGAARPTGLRVDSRERLNHPTSTTAAIVVSRRCFIFLQLSIPHPFRLQCFGRLGRVVLNRTDIPVAGFRQWTTVEIQFIELA